MNHTNNIDKHLELKLFEERNKSIKYLDLSIHRNTNSTDMEIYSKPTLIDVTLQFSSNRPLEHKLANTFNFYVNRMLTPPITKRDEHQEWKIILAIAQNNGFPLHVIQNPRKKLITKKQRPKPPTTTTQQTKKWVTFSTNTRNN